jgi:hypothetical protein
MALRLVEVVAYVMEDNLDDRDPDPSYTQLTAVLEALLNRSFELHTDVSSSSFTERHDLDHPLGTQVRDVQNACNYFVKAAARALLVERKNSEVNACITALVRKALVTWIQTLDT